MLQASTKPLGEPTKEKTPNRQNGNHTAEEEDLQELETEGEEETIHQEATSELVAAPGSHVRAQQEAAIAANQQEGEKKREPVRNVGKKVGRNDPCPCGSGKKFKACCMRKEATTDRF